MSLIRRDFIKAFSSTLFITGKITLLQLIAISKTAVAQASSMVLATPGEKMAKKIAYFHTKDEASQSSDTKKGLSNVSVPWEERYCDNCGHYGKSKIDNLENVGTCKLLPNNLVKAKGICNLWKPI